MHRKSITPSDFYSRAPNNSGDPWRGSVSKIKNRPKIHNVGRGVYFILTKYRLKIVCGFTVITKNVLFYFYFRRRNFPRYKYGPRRNFNTFLSHFPINYGWGGYSNIVSYQGGIGVHILCVIYTSLL